MFWPILFIQPCIDIIIQRTGNVRKKKLNEISGIVEGKDNILWVHNDSGDDPVVYGLSPKGKRKYTVKLEGAKAKDWEDIAIHRKTTGNVLYVGDIGDNLGIRKKKRIYFFPETTTENIQAKSFTVDYGAIGPQDAEGMAIDQRTGDLFITTKGRSGNAYVLRKAAPHIHGQHASMDLVHRIVLTRDAPRSKNPFLYTAMDISPDGNQWIVRNYVEAYLWYRQPNEPLKSMFSRSPCTLSLPLQQQGESLAFSRDGKALWSISEGQEVPIYYLPLQKSPDP